MPQQQPVIKQDSFTLGTAGKEGAIKVYFDVKSTKDDDLKELVRRAIGLWKYAKTLPP